MSGTKRISALTELASTSVAGEDIIPVVDMSQASVTDKTKHITVDSLLGGANTDAKVSFKTVALLLADTTVLGYSGARFNVATGDIVTAGGYRYEVAASGASDNHVATAGGVKLYVRANTSGEVDVAQWGIATGTSADATDTIQAALDDFEVVTVQAQYRVDGTIEIPMLKTLLLRGGGRLTKTTASGNTDPVVWLQATRGTLRGEGSFQSIIETQKACPRGVVQVGPQTYSTASVNTQGCVLEGLFIEGSTVGGQTSGTPDSGIFLTCGDGVGSTNFYHHMNDIRVSQANISLRLQGNVNMCRFSNFYSQNIGNASVASAMVYMEGCVDNTFTNFTLSASSATTFIKMTDQGALRCSANVGSSMVCEQGGSGLFMDANSGFTGTNNFFSGSANTGTAISLSSDFIEDGNQLIINGVVYTAHIRFPPTHLSATDVNTLDDYERGTWTPEIDSETTGNGDRATTVNSARYIKIGRMVWIHCHIVLGTLGTGGSGTLVVRGLPFTSLSDSSQHAAGITVARFSGLASNVVNIAGEVVPGNTIIRIRGAAAAATGNGNLAFSTYAAASMSLTLTGCYQAAT